MLMYLLIAARNLLQARRRTALLGLALAGVTALLVVLLSLSAGITDSMQRSATTLSTGHVNIGGFFKTKPSDAAPVVLDTAGVRKVVEEKVPGLAYVIDRHRGFGKFVSDTNSLMSGLTGIEPAQESRLAAALTLARESDYREGGSDERKGDLSRLGQPGTVVIFAGNAKKLGVQVGDAITVAAASFNGVSNSVEVTVVAIVEDIGLLSVWTNFVAKKTVLDLYQLKPETTGAVMVYLDDIRRADEVMGILRAELPKAGYDLMPHDPQPFFVKFDPVSGEDWTGQKLDVTTWSDEVSFMAGIITGLNVVSVFLVIILLVIIVIGIMNTMWISVRERTGEIGTLRAIGMGEYSVLLLFLLEAVVMGAVAATVGALVGALLVTGIDLAQFRVPWEPMKVILLSDKLHLLVSAGPLAGSVIAFTLVAGLSALWPAWRAAKMPPVTAIQTVT
jgi:putative ABC transport system permease protein